MASRNIVMKKQYTLFWISFAAVFGLLVLGSSLCNLRHGQNNAEIFVLGPHLCSKIWVRAMFGLSSGQSIRNALPRIRWIHWWPRTRISALLRCSQTLPWPVCLSRRLQGYLKPWPSLFKKKTVFFMTPIHLISHTKLSTVFDNKELDCVCLSLFKIYCWYRYM